MKKPDRRLKRACEVLINLWHDRGCDQRKRKQGITGTVHSMVNSLRRQIYRANE